MYIYIYIIIQNLSEKLSIFKTGPTCTRIFLTR